jgi:hypothetical protein
MMRRNILLGPIGVMLVGCSGTTPTSSQLITDLTTIVNGLSTTLPAIAAADPALAPKLAPLIAQLPLMQSDLQGLKATAAAPNAGTLAEVDQWLNTVVSTAASIPLIPPPYSLALQAAAVLLPVIESQINPMLAPAASRASTGPVMTPDQARLILQGAK